MLLVLWSLLAPAASMVVIGAAVRGLLARGKALDEIAWAQVPFVGLAVTVLVLQTQLYLDVPINRGVCALWGLAALALVAWVWRGPVRESLRQIPWLPAAACALVLAVHGYGLAVIGPRDYVGRTWADQFNYTAEAEYYRTEGYELRQDNLGQRPWALTVISLKDHRIGQSVLHSYHGVLSRMDTLAQFMPTIFLGFPLLVLALYQCGRGLGLSQWQATWAGLFGGLVPGVALLAQESFLSHVLGMPLLLTLPPMLHAYTTKRDGASLGTAALCLGALATVYTEFLVFELVLVAGFLVVALMQRPRTAPHLAGYVLLLASPWLCNPLYQAMTSFLAPSAVATRPFVLGHIYPWAYDNICLAVMWIGDFCLEPAMVRRQVTMIRVGKVVMLAGAMGLLVTGVLAVVRWWRGERAAAPGLALALVGLAAVPGLLHLRGPQYPYQFAKLLITFCPLFALGAVLLAAHAVRLRDGLWSTRAVRPVAWCLAWLPVAAMTAAAGGGSAVMAVRSSQAGVEGWRMYHQQVALSQDFRQLRHRLEKTGDLDLLVRPASLELHFQQYWTLYFARHNRVWMATSVHNDSWDVLAPGSQVAYLADVGVMPEQFHVVGPRNSLFVQPPKGLPDAAMLWQTSGHQLWRHDGRPWACVLDAENPNGPEPSNDRLYWLGGGDTIFRLFATQPGVVRLHIELSGGPCLGAGEKIRLRVQSGCSESVLEVSPGPLDLPLGVHKGVSRVAVTVLNEKRQSAGGDPRPLLALLHARDLDFEPHATATAWACVAQVDNPNSFEDESRRVLWLGGGETVLKLCAGASGVARIELEVVGGPCVDPAEVPRFLITGVDGTQRVVELTPGRQTLEVAVEAGVTTVRVRPLSVPRGSLPSDPRPLVARWTLGEVHWRPAP
jgi:hypothetical protein